MPGNPVADFSLPATGGGTFRLSEQRGKKLVLYFYPKDNTPGCTTEGMQFRDLHMNFRKAGCDLYGISRDALRSHENFKAKLHFPFELLGDADEQVWQTGPRHRAQHLRHRRRGPAGARMARGEGARPRTGGTRLC